VGVSGEPAAAAGGTALSLHSETSNGILEKIWYFPRMPTWGFLTNHALVLLCIARDPGVRLRDIAASVGITERSAFGIVSDLAVAGYIVKEKGGRRNRYRVETQCPVPESVDRYIAIGDLLALLGGQDVGLAGTGPEPG
jgi:hypothetical protein